MREAELKLRMPGLDALVRHQVTAQQVHQDPCGGAQVALPGGPVAAKVALVGDHRRFVDRDPRAGQGSELVRDARRNPGEVLWRFGRVPAARLGDPGWVREVMQGDQGLYAAVTQGLQNVPVVRQRRRRELSGRRLDPRPFDGESMRVLTQGPQQVKVTGKSFVMPAGRVGPVSVLYMPGDLLPGPPVVGVVAAFDLMGRRGRAPKKILRKPAGDHGCCTMIARIMARTISASTRTTTAPIGPTTAATARSLDTA